MQAKRDGQVGNGSESNLEQDEQYVLPDQIELDIFTKKRDFKFNQDDVQERPGSKGFDGLDEATKQIMLRPISNDILVQKAKAEP